ncbi:hypothetical protein DHW03_17555 [Pedobacter yonginense]|uniref:Uncharacterized protein n=1 Tax=Pedobacter yonginense TaxID=651869 RepID=A0A317EL29_9SPHI|nr:hypothetical protein DHW03_17555 [Pedobacter yonginense]
MLDINIRPIILEDISSYKKIIIVLLLSIVSNVQFVSGQKVDLSKQNVKIGLGLTDAYISNPFIKKAFIFSISVSLDK